MVKSISLMMLFTLSVLPGFDQVEQKKQGDRKSILVLPFGEDLIEKDTFSLKPIPDPWYQDTSMAKFNMPIARPYSTDPMLNFHIAEPGVTYHMLNSMGPDHYTRPLSTDTLKIDRYKSDER